jgi:hypothetical protein
MKNDPLTFQLHRMIEMRSYIATNANCARDILLQVLLLAGVVGKEQKHMWKEDPEETRCKRFNRNSDASIDLRHSNRQRDGKVLARFLDLSRHSRRQQG